MKKIIPIYKPIGPTSHDIVDQVRKITGIRKVGHAGTLDPLAEGVLVIAITREATKQISDIVKKEKEYVAKVKLGVTSITDDEEGEKREVTSAVPSVKEVEDALLQFVGNIQQVPPIYSAIKVGGKKAYQEARKGNEMKLEPREVQIKNIELLRYEYPFLDIRVTTGPGVYIRSLARDIGESLKTGAYLASLKRTRVGDFKLEDAYSLKDFEKLAKDEPYE